MNYIIINDEVILKDFINSLPELPEDLVFYCCLFARSKYLDDSNKGTMTHITSDKAQLKRFTANKKTLLTKIKQLECPIGSYVQYKTNVPDNPISPETLAVYMTINPRSLSKATKGSLRKFVDMVVDNPTHSFNPSNFAISEIQRSRGRTDWVIFDMDDKSLSYEEIHKLVKDIVGDAEYKILETRGGYHIMVVPSTINQNTNWYMELSRLPNIDQCGDIMIPIPGTFQGGFTPKFI